MTMVPKTAGTLRKGALGPVAIAFFVISAAGPLIAMAGGIPVAMLFGNGPGLPAMFVLASVILLVFAIGYAAMAREISNAGAFYAFAARGLGGTAAGATGMIALLSYNAIQIGLYGLFGAATKSLIEPITNVAMPWWSYAILALTSIAVFGYRQVDLSAKILGILVAAEYVVVLVLDVAIVHSGGDAGLSARSFEHAAVSTGSPALGLMLCFSAFIGFEATTIYSEEARDPARTVPLATYGAVLLIGIFYSLSTWAVVNGAGVDKLMTLLQSYPDPTALLFDLSDRYVGVGLSQSMRILFVTSAYASMLAFHNAIARYLFAMGREHLLPPRLGWTHERFASPHVGSVTQSLFALCVLVVLAWGGADPILVVFTLPSAVATLGVVALMAIASLSTVVFMLRHARERRWVILSSIVAFGALLAVCALAVLRFDLLAGSANRVVAWLPVTLLVAAGAGMLLARRLRRSAPERFAALGYAIAP